MATVYWWIVPDSEADASSRPANAKLVTTPESGPQYDAWVHGNSYQGQSRFQGPFTSKQAALQAPAGGESTLQQIKAGISAGAQSDVGVIGTGTRAEQAAKKTIPDLASFLAMLTDRNLWIRVVKIIAGGAILLVGLAKLTGMDKTAGSIASKAVKVAPLL